MGREVESGVKMSVDIGPEARALIARLAAIDWAAPGLDPKRANQALTAHLARLGLPAPDIVWAADVKAAIRMLRGASLSEVWKRHRNKMRRNAQDAIRHASKQFPGWREAWNRGEMAARLAARAGLTQAEQHIQKRFRQVIAGEPMLAIKGAVTAIEYSGAQSEAMLVFGNDAFSERRIAAWIAVWQRMVDACEAGLLGYWVTTDQIIAMPRPTLWHDGKVPAMTWLDREAVRLAVDALVPTSVDDIAAEPDIEVRCVMIDRFGPDRYLGETGRHVPDLAAQALAFAERILAVDLTMPVVDRPSAEAAIGDYLLLSGVPALSVRWLQDAGSWYDALVAGHATAVSFGQAPYATGKVKKYQTMPDIQIHWDADLSNALSLDEQRHQRSWLWSPALDQAVPEYVPYVEEQAWEAQSHLVTVATSGRTAYLARDARQQAEEDRLTAVGLCFLRFLEVGIGLIAVSETEVLAVPRPHMRVAELLLHSESGPAVWWEGGGRYWFWHGVHVPAHVVDAPETLTVAEIDAEPNAEIRRIMIERFGPGRYMRQGNAEIIDHDERWGTLLRKPRENDTDLLMLEVVNGTPEPDGSYKRYWLRVHPECRPLLEDEALGEPQELTALNAVASTYGMTGPDYHALMVRT